MENILAFFGRSLNWRIGTAALLGVVSISTWLAGKTPAKPSSEIEHLTLVAAAKVTREDLARTQTFDAEFRPFQEIEIYGKVSGFVETITVDVGDKVQEGQLIATIEIPELQDDLDHAIAVEKRSAEEVNRLKAAYDDAHLTFTRLDAVDKAQPGLVAQQDIDQAKSKDRETEAAWAAAKQQVDVAKADSKKLRTMLAYCQIKAPFNGVITKRSVDPGALIHTTGSAGSPLVRLSQNDRLRLVFPVSVSFVPYINFGSPLRIRIQSLGKELAGTVSRFTRKIETGTRTMDVEMDLPNTDLALIPGMYASVEVKLEHRENALVVPVEAVSRKGTPTVYIIDRENKIEERAVKLGLETPAKLEVLAGLEENDRVMIGSRSQVKPGEKVETKIIGSE